MNSMTLNTLAQEIKALLECKKFEMQNEKALQSDIDLALRQINVHREYKLDYFNIIDFLVKHSDGNIGIEVKIKGGRKDIFKQCERYCLHKEIQILILVTNRAMGFPESINDKPCYVVNISKGWL